MLIIHFLNVKEKETKIIKNINFKWLYRLFRKIIDFTL